MKNRKIDRLLLEVRQINHLTDWRISDRAIFKIVGDFVQGLCLYGTSGSAEHAYASWFVQSALIPYPAWALTHGGRLVSPERTQLWTQFDGVELAGAFAAEAAPSIKTATPSDEEFLKVMTDRWPTWDTFACKGFIRLRQGDDVKAVEALRESVAQMRPEWQDPENRFVSDAIAAITRKEGREFVERARSAFLERHASSK